MSTGALSVTQFIELVNTVFDQVGGVTVEGEVSEYKVIHNKWVTFQLKDETSTLPCFMTVWQLNTQIEDGMLVRVVGSPKLRPKGFFSFVVQTVTPAGEGALKRAFELLRKKLLEEGLFSPERKRPLPLFPKHVALITSEQAAAYSDFLKILRQRQGGLTISFINSQVQGEDAPAQLIQALVVANTELQDLDVIIMVRGGGSMEDLQAFNDERLVRAVAASRTPTIVGIGHERDVTLAELAADVRASTPSNAAEILVRSRDELLSSLYNLQQQLAAGVRGALQEQSSAILAFIHALSSRTAQATSKVKSRVEAMEAARRRFHERLSHDRQRLAAATRILSSLSPQQTLKRGYSISRSKGGKVIKRAADLTPEMEIVTTVSEGAFTSKVTQIDS
ncbi:MAG: exodeoxyribonuclease VII large subunit [Candidatus Andersenbacteria bacterium]|nr:exodeoxyribonuclease VII large subunit [Candidatus Andersenbacteria bacterium]MBI3250375.1 exodeoxyribonuclease VII large subunit [Candidatus Andersenbacteria bacterium]